MYFEELSSTLQVRPEELGVSWDFVLPRLAIPAIGVLILVSLLGVVFGLPKTMRLASAGDLHRFHALLWIGSILYLSLWTVAGFLANVSGRAGARALLLLLVPAALSLCVLALGLLLRGLGYSARNLEGTSLGPRSFVHLALFLGLVALPVAWIADSVGHRDGRIVLDGEDPGWPTAFNTVVVEADPSESCALLLGTTNELHILHIPGEGIERVSVAEPLGDPGGCSG